MNKKIKEERLKASHQGELKIGEMVIPVAVLADRERVISVRGVGTALGVKGGGAYWKLKKENPDKEMLPEFVSAQNLEPFIGDEVKELIANTIPYTSLTNQEAVGIKAEFLPRICDVWLKALNAKVLTEKQEKVAKNAYTLLSAFATVGVTALVDEVTGFQKEKDEYQKILAKYIAEELQPWLKIFGDDYYHAIYRLKGWDWNRFYVDRKNHPWAVANITNRIVYEKLPTGVLSKLRELNPTDDKGNRKYRLHQHLTQNEGQVHLLKHLGAIVNIMENHPDGDWEGALHDIDKRFPSKRIGSQATLDFPLADKNVFEGIIQRASKPLKEGKGTKE
jgi:hypothetical protein